VVDPSTFQLDPSRDVDIVYDSAYWVSGIALFDAGLLGRIEAASDALPHSNETIERDDLVSGVPTTRFPDERGDGGRKEVSKPRHRQEPALGIDL